MSALQQKHLDLDKQMTFNSKPTIASRNIQRAYSYLIQKRKSLINRDTRESKTVKGRKTITRSHFSHHHTTSIRVVRVSGLSTLYFTDNIYRKVSMENEVRSRTFILDALSSGFTAHKTHTSSYICMLPCTLP